MHPLIGKMSAIRLLLPMRNRAISARQGHAMVRLRAFGEGFRTAATGNELNRAGFDWKGMAADK